ncbi:MAG: tRNA (adenosine(37)-N6)-dimethylallyltransferase MiaA [Lachnospiraceae bacterium]|nr:tRNA (adenosine(37)-N6)-dimethylallyltransferase MiaA [Lachnospiraceae bacterium]
MGSYDLAVIGGPTASGKSAASIALAKRLNGEVISADSMQVYTHMDIGSAKISKDMMQGIPHHLIDILEPTEEFNVSLFKELAEDAVQKIVQKKSFPIICGGTGFYIQSLLYGIDFKEGETDQKVRDKYEKLAESDGLSSLEERLETVDPVSAKAYHGNKKRVIRALEYLELTGEKLSDKNKRQRAQESVYNAAYFVLTMPRELLYERIDKRVDLMMKEGLLEEVKKLMDMGITRNMTSMQGLGYRQIYDHLSGEYDLETAVYEIKKQTRHFAKRQMTWYRREKKVIFIDVTKFGDHDTSAERIADHMRDIINGQI